MNGPTTRRIRCLAFALVFGLAFFPIVGATAEPVCQFRDPSHRLISGTDPDDFRCIKLLAAAGDEHWEHYYGLILTGQVPGPNDFTEALAILKRVAGRRNKYSADAMRNVGELYMRPDTSFFNIELAYQWLYLASQEAPYKGTAYPLPNEKLSEVITPQRRKELERSAANLLPPR